MFDPRYASDLARINLNNYKIHRLNQKGGEKIRDEGVGKGKKGGSEGEEGGESRVERKGQSSVGRSIEKVRRYATERCEIRFISRLHCCVVVVVDVVVVIVLDERSRRDTRTKK